MSNEHATEEAISSESLSRVLAGLTVFATVAVLAIGLILQGPEIRQPAILFVVLLVGALCVWILRVLRRIERRLHRLEQQHEE